MTPGSIVQCRNREWVLLPSDLVLLFLAKPLGFEDFQNMVTHARGIKVTSTSEGCVLERE